MGNLKALLPSTTVIIQRDTFFCEEYLVHQRADNGYWGFPGGAQQPGESILACAQREAQEETGLVVDVGPLICLDSDPRAGAICVYADGCVQYMNCTFLCFIADETPLVCSEESTVLRWVTANALPEPFLPTHRWRFEQFQAWHARVVVR